jgi:hypothetical protein
MISRRTLLKELGAGSAILAMPSFLAACAPKHLSQNPLPTDPFGAWFGVDPLSTRLVLEELSPAALASAAQGLAAGLDRARDPA